MRTRQAFSTCATGSLLLFGLLLLTGCNNAPTMRGAPAGPPPRAANAVPTAADLVQFLNDNARRVRELECHDLDLDASERMRTVSLKGQMVAQKPHNFRLAAKVGGNTMVDMGANDQEFWYWIAKAEPPYLFHCSHQDFAQGRARIKIPFQPDWIMEALAMAEYDPAKNFQIVTKPKTFELVEQTLSPRGERVSKIIVFNRAPNQVQVAAYLIQDASGKEICSALITDVQQDQASGAVFPRRVQLNWPEEHIKLKMTLNKVTVNGTLDAERSARLFTRPILKDVQSFDLARGLAPGPEGMR